MAAARAYLDYNASAPLVGAALAAMVEALANTANPSSVHEEGRSARRIVEEARRDVAALVGGKAEHIVFTSGATEAAATLLTPDWQMGRSDLRMSRLYVSEAEHACILSGGRFPADRVARIAVDANGVVELDALTRALAAHDRSEGLALVAIHAANNETGVIQPVAEIAAVVKAAGGVFITDAVQAAGRIPIDILAGYADYLILSSHKIGGPKGAGAIAAASDLLMPKPLISGGGQERGFRAGTENVPAIAGFGTAARHALAHLGQMDEVRAKRDAVEAAILALAPEAEIFGRSAERLPNTSFFALPDLKAETVQIALDLAGVAVSTGSACSSGKTGPSHVLKAMGRGERASALRVSIGMETTLEEIEMFRSALAQILARRSGRTRAA